MMTEISQHIMPAAAGQLHSSWADRLRFWTIYRRLRGYTMIPKTSYLDNLQLAKSVANIEGCIVECGVWRGGMSAGIAAVLGAHRDYLLFDSFEGLPPAKEIDGRSALEWQKDTSSPSYHDNCAAPEEFAQRAMNLGGATKVHFYKGWFEQTLPGFSPPCPIALLRLDGDWYESTMTCLDALFNHVAPGGLIVLDDYYAWDGCSRALHDFLSRRSALERIRSHGEICYLVKKDSASDVHRPEVVTAKPDQSGAESESKE